MRLKVGGEGDGRARSGLGVAGDTLPPVEMDAHVVANPHRQPRPGIDPVQARLDPAPHSKAGRVAAEKRTGEGEAAVGEQVPASNSDDAAADVLRDPASGRGCLGGKPD